MAAGWAAEAWLNGRLDQMTDPDVIREIDRILGRAKEVMEATVLELRPELDLGEAAREMERKGVSGAPVQQDGKVVGVVSLSDMFRAIGVDPKAISTSGPWHRYEHVLHESGKTVGEVMTRPVHTLPPDAPVSEVAISMRANKINRIPIVEPSGRLVGIVTRDDIIAAVARAREHRRDEVTGPSR